MSSFTDQLVNFSAKMANNRFLQTIQRSFMKMMPITMIGGFASLFKGLSIPAYQAWLQSTPIYNILGAVYQFTVGFLGLYVAYLVAHEVAGMYGLKKSGGVEVGLISLACFLIVTPFEPAADAYSSASMSLQWLGASGMFTALITAFAVGGIFVFCEKKNLGIRMPDSVPPAIAMQFNALIPGLIAIVLFGIVSGIFAATSIGSLQQAVYTIVSAPLGALGANVFGEWILMMVLYLMWFFGIHGGMTVGPVITLLFMQAQMENLAAYQAGAPLPHLITGSYITYGSGSLPMLIAALIVCKSTTNKSISRLAVLPAFFGVDEPAYFGFPMIMNPIFFFPWVIATPTISVWVTYILQKIGFVTYYTGVNPGGFVPFFVINLVGYGVRGMIVGFIIFIVDVLIYMPFVKAYDKQMLKTEAETKKEAEEA